MKPYYITTAIPYVNAAPHLGHALEFVQADVLARHRRLRGQPVRFLSGTDDHALKNVIAARSAGTSVADYVANAADRFEALQARLELSCDDYIRTSSDGRHRPGVEFLWHRCADADDFYHDPAAYLPPTSSRSRPWGKVRTAFRFAPESGSEVADAGPAPAANGAP